MEEFFAVGISLGCCLFGQVGVDVVVLGDTPAHGLSVHRSVDLLIRDWLKETPGIMLAVILRHFFYFFYIFYCLFFFNIQ